ncbi:uncharacterized protein PG986_014439 [Apiospora aurea]|uniref:AA1-like domain-containing protein n=1 Tax=Apiospora aurea TaxID=335848 RepID=A0ABR1PT11_9PEZI
MQHVIAAWTALSAATSPMRSQADRSGREAAALGHFAWEIKHFQYQAMYPLSMPLHQDTRGNVSFHLSNPALAYESQCSASSSQPFGHFHGATPLACSEEPEATTTQTIFEFKSLRGTLNIEQTWVCSDEDPQWP